MMLPAKKIVVSPCTKVNKRITLDGVASRVVDFSGNKFISVHTGDERIGNDVVLHGVVRVYEEGGEVYRFSGSQYGRYDYRYHWKYNGYPVVTREFGGCDVIIYESTGEEESDYRLEPYIIVTSLPPISEIPYGYRVINDYTSRFRAVSANHIGDVSPTTYVIKCYENSGNILSGRVNLYGYSTETKELSGSIEYTYDPVDGETTRPVSIYTNFPIVSEMLSYGSDLFLLLILRSGRHWNYIGQLQDILIDPSEFAPGRAIKRRILGGSPMPTEEGWDVTDTYIPLLSTKYTIVTNC